MSWVVTLILLLVVLAYIVFGGVVFHVLESRYEDEARARLNVILRRFLESNTCVDNTSLTSLLDEVLQTHDAGVASVAENTTSPTNWDLQSSIFFATTVISTIGYGNTTPKTPGGFAFTVAFALIGIPLFLVLLVSIGVRQRAAVDRLLSRCLPATVVAAARDGGQQTPPTCRWTIYQVVRVVVNVAFFAVLFCLVPAAVFHQVERWSYGEALYYACITITTVGFGDYVAGASTDVNFRGWYKLALACWIILGLASCASFLATLQDVYSTLVNRADGKAAAVNRDKHRNVRDAATAATDENEGDGGTSAVRPGDTSLQSDVTELDDQQDK